MNTKMNQEVKNIKNITAPYLTVSKLDEVINLASNRTYSDFPASLFVNRGFSPADSFLAVNTLKFLNLIDEDGKPTSAMPKIGLKGDARKAAFKEIVESAYAKLFAVVQKPYELPTDELFNEMKTQYNLSPRVARQAVPVFRKLCELAGFIEEGSVVGRKRGPKPKDAKKTKHSGTLSRTPEQLDEVATQAGFSPIRVAEGRMVLNIPSELKDKILESDDEKLHTAWRNLRSALKKFADDYIPEDQSQKKPSEKESEGG